MELHDSQPPARGEFRLRIFRAGRLIEDYVDRNLVVDAAKTSHAKLIGGDGSGKTITKIAFGTSGAGPYPADTAVTGGLSKLLSGHDYPAAGQVRFSWTLAANEAVGTTIREFGLICSDGTLYARKTRSGIEKTDDMTLEGSWTILF